LIVPAVGFGTRYPELTTEDTGLTENLFLRLSILLFSVLPW
jgi:hypothetical protein